MTADATETRVFLVVGRSRDDEPLDRFVEALDGADAVDLWRRWNEAERMAPASAPEPRAYPAPARLGPRGARDWTRGLPGAGASRRAEDLTAMVAAALLAAEAEGLDPGVVLALGAAVASKARAGVAAAALDAVGREGPSAAAMASLGGPDGPAAAWPPASDGAVALSRVVGAIEAVPGYAPGFAGELRLAAGMGLGGLSGALAPGRPATLVAEAVRAGLLVISAQGGHLGRGPAPLPRAGPSDEAVLDRLARAARRHGSGALRAAAAHLADGGEAGPDAVEALRDLGL